jgi:hypothetical protein
MAWLLSYLWHNAQNHRDRCPKTVPTMFTTMFTSRQAVLRTRCDESGNSSMDALAMPPCRGQQCVLSNHDSLMLFHSFGRIHQIPILFAFGADPWRNLCHDVCDYRRIQLWTPRQQRVLRENQETKNAFFERRTFLNQCVYYLTL